MPSYNSSTDKRFETAVGIIITASVLMFFSGLMVYKHSAMVEKPDSFCSVEVTYRAQQAGKILKDTVCVERELFSS